MAACVHILALKVRSRALSEEHTGIPLNACDQITKTASLAPAQGAFHGQKPISHTEKEKELAAAGRFFRHNKKAYTDYSISLSKKIPDSNLSSFKLLTSIVFILDWHTFPFNTLMLCNGSTPAYHTIFRLFLHLFRLFLSNLPLSYNLHPLVHSSLCVTGGLPDCTCTQLSFLGWVLGLVMGEKKKKVPGIESWESFPAYFPRK